MALQSVMKELPFDLNPTSYLSLFCFIIAIFVFNLTRSRSKPNVPPSPPKLPLIGHLHQLGTQPHHTFRALSHKYGPLMLLHLGHTPTLVVSSADIAREIVKSHDVVFSDRPQTVAAKILLYGLRDVGFAPYGEEWRQRRKICVVELLSLKRVQSFQYIREEEAADLVKQIREACKKNNGCSVNLSQMLIAASNDIVSRCVLGQKYDRGVGNSSFGDVTRKVMYHLAAFSVGNFFPSLGWMDHVTGLIPKVKATFQELDSFFDEVIEQRKMARKNGDDNDEQSEKKDFMDIIIQLQNKNTLDIDLTHEDLKALILDMFVAGSDTTSTTLEWAFAELMKNPETMKKAQEEVRRIVGHKSTINENDVRQMKYLQCVVKETLRLHPQVPLIVPRETRSGVKLKGYDIPPKTTVFINAWAIQRDPQLWKKPEEFIPERFENSEVDFKGQDFQFIPFGIGRRGCPGMSFGVASLEYLLANLLYWFNWKLPATCKSAQDFDMSETYGLTCNKKVPILVEPTPYLVGSKA